MCLNETSRKRFKKVRNNLDNAGGYVTYGQHPKFSWLNYKS